MDLVTGGSGETSGGTQTIPPRMALYALSRTAFSDSSGPPNPSPSSFAMFLPLFGTCTNLLALHPPRTPALRGAVIGRLRPSVDPDTAYAIQSLRPLTELCTQFARSASSSRYSRSRRQRPVALLLSRQSRYPLMRSINHSAVQTRKTYSGVRKFGT